MVASIKVAFRNRIKWGLIGLAVGVAGLIPAYMFPYQDWKHGDDIRITSLNDSKGEAIPRCLKVLRGSGKLQHGHHLWISVEFPKKSGKVRTVFAREAIMRNGKWRADNLNVGGEDPAGTAYTLAAVDVDKRTHEMLASAVIDMSDSGLKTLPAGDNLWRLSFRGYPSGVQSRADVGVVRDANGRLSCQEVSAGLK
ncbi:hypothetical protein ACFWDI_01225 [Streptomyces sp. NPDC060064]|uniref:hypothetical protein n=1 Tax=Streptomyces sp. NPDC060064 TaxID=3347049 RepID=UPI0036CAD17B